MPHLMIRCSQTGKDTRTGIDTDFVSFEKFPDIFVYSRCQHCGLEHGWRPEDAWLADEDLHSQKPTMNQRPAAGALAQGSTS